MAISNETRRAGPYLGDGLQTQFPFEFVVLDEKDVAVYLFTEETDESSKLDSAQYTVVLNENQDNNPGGLVTTTNPLPVGQNLSVISEMPYLQPMVLTNRGGFYPDTLNRSADRETIMSQQLKEMADRAIRVPAASTETPEEFTVKLLKSGEDARRVAGEAQSYAEAARLSAESAEESAQQVADAKDQKISEIVEAGNTELEKVNGASSTHISAINALGAEKIEAINTAGSDQISAITTEGTDRLDAITTEGVAQVSAVKAEGQTQLQNVTTEGNYQYDRVRTAGDQTLVDLGAANVEISWTASEPIAEGTVFTLPMNMQYIVGRNQLRLCLNGLQLYKPSNFTEVGDQDLPSTQVKFAFDVKVGDEFQAFAASLGRGDAEEAITRTQTLETDLADLSRKVVYREKEGN